MKPRISFIALIILASFLLGCSRSGDNEIGNYTQIAEDGSEWGILPEGEITNPDVLKILTDTVIPFLENNFRSPDRYFIKIFPDEENNMFVFNAEKNTHFSLTVGNYKQNEEAYIYYNNYLIILFQKVDYSPKYFKAKSNYLAFKSLPQDFRDNIIDDSIIFWYYDIDRDSLKLLKTNEFYKRRSEPPYQPDWEKITIAVRHVDDKRNIIF